MIRRNWLLCLLVLPGLISALVLAGHRYGLESRNKAVELALDYGELQNLSASSGIPMPALLQRFKAAGVTSVAISETLLGDLAATGQVYFQEVSSPKVPCTIVYVPDAQLAGRVFHSLGARLGIEEFTLSKRLGERSAPGMEISIAPTTLSLMGIGLPPDEVALVKASGLRVIARLQNNPAITEKAIGAALSELREDGITKLIYAGDSVLGFRGLVQSAARQIESSGLIYGSVEFAKQKGDSGTCRYLDGRFVRVHSIPTAEMAGMAAGTAVERFARGVKERNIRLCYVRLVETSGKDPVKSNLAFVNSIRHAVTTAGYDIGSAHPFEDTKQSPVLLSLIALSAAAGLALLLSSTMTVSAGVQIGLLILGFLVFAGLTFAGEFGKQLTALAVALVFPTLGVIRVYGPYFGRQIKGSYRHPVLRSTSRFVRASAYSLTGGLMIAGMLGTRAYMVKNEQFLGIKAAHLLPMLVVVLVIAAGLPFMNESLPEVWKRVRANLKEIVASPLFIWQAIALIFVLGIIGVALLRTGNDPGVGVSGIELKFRAILDKIMYVRPRTKEFLIGHPALILGAAFLFARRRSIGLPLLALGVLGQVSLLNTFCHIHTSLVLAGLRAFNGLVLGAIISLVVWWILGRPIVRATDPSAEKADEK